MTHTPTPDLVERLQRQDPEALRDFYKEYGPSVLNVARSMVNDPWDAEEVLQDVAWTVFRKADTFQGRTDFWWWVVQVTRNCARMLLRKRKRVPTPMTQDEVDYLIETRAAHTIATPEQSVTLQRVERLLDDEMGKLDPLNRKVYEAMDIKGQPKEEAAAALGLTVEALKSRLHRVRRALRESINGEMMGARLATA